MPRITALHNDLFIPPDSLQLFHLYSATQKLKTMDKKHFALKLIPPRPSFAMDMTDEERQVMQQHIGFWSDLMNKGIAIVFGPVLDPNGVYGLGIVSVDHEDQVADITKNDPAATINRYEVYPMMAITAASNK